MKKVKSGLIQQNCYIRSTGDKYVKEIEDQNKEKYVEVLTDVQNEDGDIVERLIKKPYDITPEFVASFAMADYRVDPEGAIVRGHKLPNLGDVASMQDFRNMSPEEQKRTIDTLQQKYNAYQQAMQQNEKSKDKNKNDDVKEEDSDEG